MKKVVYILVLILVITACKEKFNPVIPSADTNYLVVEGFINNGSAATVIKLTRTTKISDQSGVNYERNAQVNVEGETSGRYLLPETSAGIYTFNLPVLNNNQRYRVHIKTSNGDEYVSDYSSVKTTPGIDTVSWQRENKGVQFYVNTHDPTNKAKYYQWSFDETWEIHSAYTSSLKFVNNPTTNAIELAYRDPVTHGPDLSIYKCWQTGVSTSLIIGSTDKLDSAVVLAPVNFLAPGTIKTSVLYSMNLKQTAISFELYQFLETMKKNTEQLGSVFDPQPSALHGNIHCISDPTRIAIGFIEVSQQQEKRIFLNHTQVPDMIYLTGCDAPVEVKNNSTDILKLIQSTAGGMVTPTDPSVITPTGSISSFLVAAPICVDCTLIGSNSKPSFWP